MVSFSSARTSRSGTMSSCWPVPERPAGRKGIGGEACWSRSSSGKFAWATTSTPGTRTWSRPPTWSEWAWVRTTWVIGAAVTVRTSARAARRCAPLLVVSTSTIPSPVSTTVTSAKSNPCATCTPGASSTSRGGTKWKPSSRVTHQSVTSSGKSGSAGAAERDRELGQDQAPEIVGEARRLVDRPVEQAERVVEVVAGKGLEEPCQGGVQRLVGDLLGQLGEG